MLNRRRFLQTSVLAAGIAPLAAVADTKENRKPLIKPPALKKGDTVGLITPASPLFEAHQIMIEAREKMEGLGFKVKFAKNVMAKRGYLAGTIEQRVSDLHDMFLDDSVKAIIAIRGGYGSAQLLPYLDYELIAKHPKILLGYSDITAILNGIHHKTGLVTFHGPVAVSTFTEYTTKYLFKVLGEAKPVGEIEDAPYAGNLQSSNRVWTYRGGTGEGRLVGGNLTLLQSLLGTPYEFDGRGALYFIEEVGEEPYDIDRMLWQLKMAGKFERCNGVIFDKMPSVKPADYKPGFNSSLSVEEIIDDIFKDYSFPVCVGLSLGHIKEKPTMPLGVRARLDGDAGRIALLEAAVK